MVSVSVFVLSLCALGGLLVTSAFFSSAEIAVFSLQHHRIQSLVGAGDRRARALEALREDPNRLLVTILIGNNVAAITFSTVMATLLDETLPGGYAVVAATVLATVLVVLFGEIAPKAYGVANAESWSLRVAGPLRWLERAFAPVIWAFDTAADAITPLFGDADTPKPYVTREEIVGLLHTGAQLGVIDDDEREAVNSLLALEETAVGEFMTPLAAVVSVPASTTPGDARNAALDAGATHVLVTDERGGVRGVVALRTLAEAARDGRALDAVLEEPLLVRDVWTGHDLYAALREGGQTAAVVRNSQGTPVGLVTRSDLANDVLWWDA